MALEDEKSNGHWMERLGKQGVVPAKELGEFDDVVVGVCVVVFVIEVVV